MSTIFGHGRLRLYLLRLLDESPRHGYEIITLLRDRFLGVYSPSPGTVYPRLGRLEEEGLVTHEERDGRKIYRLTDKGRAELRERSAELADLEREITESARDVAQAVRRDVRDTISSLREELKSATGGGDRDSGRSRRRTGTADTEDVWGQAGAEDTDSTGERSAGDSERSHDWERLARGFASWGAERAKRYRSREQRTAERALGDFVEEARRLLRDTGQLSEVTLARLHRILDDTVETIKRDVAGWGPPTEKGHASEDATPGTDTDR